MRVTNKTLIANLEILLGGSFFGLIPIFIRFGKNIDVTQLVFFRAFFGTISIAIIAYLTGNKIKRIKSGTAKIVSWAFILLLAIVSYFTALIYIDIASAALLLNFQSFFIIIFSRFLLKEKIYLHTIISFILSLVGVILIISPSGFSFQGRAIGYLFAISAAFFAGLNFVFPKKYLEEDDPYTQTFFQNLWQLPFVLPFIFITDIDVSLKSISIFIGLGLFCTALAFLFIYKGSKTTKTQYVGVLQTSESIVPIILGVIIFSETPSLIVVIGGLMLIAGYFVILFKDSFKTAGVEQ